MSAADIVAAAIPSDAEDDDNLDISALCPYCNTKPPVYTCPRCFARTCSVACSKKHKLYRQCNGVRDPTAYVKRSRLMTEGGVNRDYAFLTGLEKQISKPVDPVAQLKEELEEKAREEKEKELEQAGDKKSRRKKPIIDRQMQKTRIEELLHPNNTTVKWAPWEGFKRAKENQTRVVAATKRRSAHVEWTIEWTFLDHDERKILDHAVHEKSQVDYAFFHLDGLRSDASVSKHPDEARIGTHGIKKQTSFYLVLEAPANKKRCVKMDPVKSWSENLRGRSVVEFPQVLVTAKRNPEELGWEVARDERKIVELENEVESAKPKQIDVPKSSREVKSLDETAPAITIEALTSTAPTAPKATSNELGDTQILEKRKQPDDDILSTLAAIKKARKT